MWPVSGEQLPLDRATGSSVMEKSPGIEGVLADDCEFPEDPQKASGVWEWWVRAVQLWEIQSTQRGGDLESRVPGGWGGTRHNQD